MVRTLVLAGLVTLFGATASDAQYQDSAPPDDYDSDYDTESTYDGTYDDGYDEELLGSPEYNRRGESQPDIDVGIFGSLGNDGSWHFAANFGWVWRPYCAVGWRPYTAGRWVYSSYGWTWVSYEPFGWATYHYGYWTRDPMWGWVWIPGYEWSACRAQFAYYDNYVCWTPLPPPGYHCPQPWSTAGISVWFTVGAHNFCDPYPARYCVTPRYKSVYAQTVAYKSPSRHFVERYTGASIRTSTVKFKNTSWSKVDRGTYSSNPDRFVTKSSRSQKSEPRFVAPRDNRSGSYAMKSKPRFDTKRQFQSVEPRRSTLKRDVVKHQRESRASNFTRTERPSKQQFRPQESRKAYSMRDVMKSQSGRERQVARSERPSKQNFKASPTREQRSFQKAQRAERTSRPSFQTSRGSSERKAVASHKQADRRDVAKKSGSGKGRGKAK